jgi:hypothetical protein
MAPEQQESSPLDFWLSKHGYTYEQVFFRRLADLALNTPRPPEIEKISKSLSFFAWAISPYLYTSRMSRKMLESLFNTVLHTPGQIPTSMEWIQLCIAVTPPFRTEKPNHVLDMKKRGRGWVRCDERHKLIETLATACFTYECRCQKWFYNWMADKCTIRVRLLSQEIDKLHFMDLRIRERLPAALKGVRTENMEEAFAIVAHITQHLPRDGRDAVSWEQYQESLHAWYNELLCNMRDAFRQYCPRNVYPKGARHEALSAILSPLLYPNLHPHRNCTTPGAIQKRLSRLKFA